MITHTCKHLTCDIRYLCLLLYTLSSHFTPLVNSIPTGIFFKNYLTKKFFFTPWKYFVTKIEVECNNTTFSLHHLLGKPFLLTHPCSASWFYVLRFAFHCSFSAYCLAILYTVYVLRSPLHAGLTRHLFDNIYVTNKYLLTMNNDNLSNLNDIYLIVSSTNFNRTPELLEFLDVMISIEEEFQD